MSIQIRFWWEGYTPEQALTSFDPVVSELPFEVSRDEGQTWRPPKDGATLSTVYDWMLDHEMAVVDTALVGQRRRGRWEGQFVLALGQPEGERHAPR